ncbi:MAG: glycine cleavage system protein GcvH [Dehalococcoidia bacterium]
MAGGNSIPEDLKYSTEHEWLRIDGDVARVGITDYAQDQLGDIVFVDLPKVGETVKFMGKFGEIESVKVASEIFSPAAGEIAEINDALDASPELVNKDPYGDGWLVAIRLSNAAEVEELLDAAGYAKLVAKERGEG